MSPTQYAVYEKETGRIIKAVTCDASLIQLQVGPGEDFVEAPVASADFYVDPGDRKVKPCKDYTLARLPVPCAIFIEGVRYWCVSQPSFTFDIPGKYQIEVDAGAQYKRKVFDYDYLP